MGQEDKIVSRFTRAQDSLVLQASDLSLETIANMVENGAIDISPHYQRRERWAVAAQSSLIESFLLNIPVPPVYLAEEDFGVYSVIDGKQRITAIKGFMRNEYALVDLQTFTGLEGSRFSDLPIELKNALLVRPYIRAVTLLRQSDPNLKYEVFVRLNTGGEPLLAQEIRNVAYSGPLNDLIFQLTENQFLRQQLKIANDRSAAFRLMMDAEMVLRFFALSMTWENFSGNLRRSMDSFMQRNRNMSLEDLASLKYSFERCIYACEEIWGQDAFKRPHNGAWRDQFLAGMYDSQMLSINELSDFQLGKLINNKDRALAVVRELFDDNEFESSVRQGTNTPSRLRYRVASLKQALLSIV